MKYICLMGALEVVALITLVFVTVLRHRKK